MLELIQSLWSDTTLVGIATGAVVAQIGRSFWAMRREAAELRSRTMEMSYRIEDLQHSRMEDRQSWDAERTQLMARLENGTVRLDGATFDLPPNAAAFHLVLGPTNEEREACSFAQFSRQADGKPAPITQRSIKRTLS